MLVVRPLDCCIPTMFPKLTSNTEHRNGERLTKQVNRALPKRRAGGGRGISRFGGGSDSQR